MSSSSSRQSSMVVPAAQHPLHQKDPESTASIHELPVEILSAIFLEVVTNPAKGSTPHLEQNSLLSVGRHWHDVILSIPGAWRLFWIRPSPLSSSGPAPAAASTTSPGPSGHATGWLGLEEARRRLQWAISNPSRDLPVSIMVDLSGAQITSRQDWMQLRWETVNLLCDHKVMALWKSIEIWDPQPTVIARDLVQFASKGPLSPFLERLSVGFPTEKIIRDLDDAIISAYQVAPEDLAGRDFNPSREGKGLLRELHLPSIRLTPPPNSSIYSNIVSLHILDNLCDPCRNDRGNPTYVLARLIDLCPRLRDLGLRCGHLQTNARELELTMARLAKLNLSLPPFATTPVLMPDPEVTVHEGVRSLLIYGPTYRCPAIKHFRFPRVENVTVKGWVEECKWAPRLLFPPPGTENGPQVELIP
ncbi:hypothetical protein FS837_010637 [Tulasnella sp. UAMH 9824]|nr:hypothetical protein FS837_010637 [Tulasnella sp. UAMH 9824]